MAEPIVPSKIDKKSLSFADYCSLVFSGLICLINLFFVYKIFPFWGIYEPVVGVSFAFTLLFLLAPLILIDALTIARLRWRVRTRKNQETKKPYRIMVFVLSACTAFVFIGNFHNMSMSYPENNFNQFFRQREYIVKLVKSGKLKGNGNCFQLESQSSKEPISCMEIIELPNAYAGLSRSGKIELLKAANSIKIVFTHSTYGFGDGRSTFVYFESGDNQSSLPNSRATQLRPNWFLAS